MNVEQIIVRKLVADEGHVLASADKKNVYGTEIFLGKDDLPENYVMITEEEGEEIKRNELVLLYN